MKRILPLLLALASVAFGGQSLVLNSSGSINLTDPVVSQNQSWRAEFQLHNFTLPSGYPNLFWLQGLGAQAALYQNGILAVNSRDSDQLQQPCMLNVTGMTNILVRFQKNAATMSLSCEVWNYDGTQYQNQFDTLTSLVPGQYPGGLIYPTVSGALGFIRVFTTLVPIGSKPPTTADGGDWTELKFDGNLNDSSGHGHGGAGSPVYMATPNQVAFSLPRTLGAPSWNTWSSLRAGYPAQLDGTSSYSLADSSSAVTYAWAQTNGPSPAIWASNTAAIPTITGLVFGTYDFTLQVTDVNGSSSTAQLETGAVAADNNGVVINADPNVDKLFGPMIAFGKNPWGFEDYWEYHAMNLRAADYQTSGWDAQQWKQTGSGTVSFYFNGVGYYPGNQSLGTKLASAITAQSTSLTVANAAGLDLSDFPTRILLVASSGATEEIRICSASGNVLNGCYDGRGQNAQSWNTGATVGQSKVTGAGTQFLSDPVVPVCPLGAPGPPGPASYTSGSVTLTAGSATVTGTGTTWTNSLSGNYIRVAANHGGNPFYFVAIVNTVSGGTSIALNRPFPADADTGTYTSYAIMPASRTIDLRYPHAVDPGGNGQLLFGTTGCESQTDVYLNPMTYGNSLGSGHDIPVLDGRYFTNELYSVSDTGGWLNESSTGGINFYGESLASRSFYYRSGLTAALNAANVMDDNWITSPYANPDGNGYPQLFLGGGAIGAFASGILTGRVSWSDLRGYANMGETMANGIFNSGSTFCEYTDTRDAGYAYAWLVLGALFDPDTAGFQARWRKDLATMQANDGVCRRADGSWSNGFLWNTSVGPLTLQAGSVQVTGTNIPTSACAGVTTGTGTVSNGSAIISVASGSIPAGSVATTLIVNGAMGGRPFTASYNYGGSGPSATMAALWPGDSGNVTWMASNVSGSNNNALTTIATSTSDYSDLANNYACIWNSATSITLDHPWQGAKGSNYYLYSSNLAGFGQQPFTLGIGTYAMSLLANATDPSLASYATAYNGYVGQAANWLRTTGYDPVTQGLYYGRVFAFCEPATTPPPLSAFSARTPGCNYGGAPAAIVEARELNAEIAHSLSVLYNLSPTAANKTWGDTVYGSLWGYAPYNTGNVYSDALSPAANPALATMSDAFVNGGKWYGFFAGMGMAHEWPAARLGGVASASNSTVLGNLALGTAASAQIVVTAPSGRSYTIACASVANCSAVSLPVDNRQGSYAYTIQYLSASGTVLSTVSGITPEITGSPTLAATTVGTPYSASVNAMGGPGTLTLSIVSGTLPPGLKMSATGAITGTPLAARSFTFGVQVTDTLGFAATSNLTVTVSP